jgi:hypothetical protein
MALKMIYKTQWSKTNTQTPNPQSQSNEMKLLLQVGAAVGIAGKDRRGGHAPSSLGPPLQSFVRAAVCWQHFSVMIRKKKKKERSQAMLSLSTRLAGMS